ncbi:MAG: hypothetical protein CL878_12680 [Dehalococcoidia bacterium]|nr:hypothetical protein [Dehalococcoidia bacterium]
MSRNQPPKAVAPHRPSPLWLRTVQLVVLLVVALAILVGAGGLPTYIRAAQSAAVQIIQGSFSARRAPADYQRESDPSQPVQPVRIAVTPTVVTIKSQP